MTYITASGLAFSLPDTTTLFSDLNFSFNRGRTAIVGKNGVGKTTLLRLIQKKMEPTAGTIINHGDWEVLPQDLTDMEHQNVLDILQIKDIYSAYTNIISGEYSEEDYSTLNNRWDIETEIAESLSQFGFPDIDLERSFSSFSGGEKIRLLLSRVLLKNPDFFLMDEPTNNLDKETRQYIYDFITHWKKGIVLISHDRTLLDLMDHIYELTPRGIKHYAGNFNFYQQQKELEETKLQQDLITAEKKLKKTKRIGEQTLRKHQKRSHKGHKDRASLPKATVAKWKNSSEKNYGVLKHQSEKRTDQAKQQYDNLLKERESSLKIRVDLLGELKHKKKILIKAESINFRYHSDFLWKDDLSLLIQGQERVLITGRNGRGKSTLCRLITGELTPQRGNLEVNVHRISILDQNFSCIKRDLTLLENMELFADPGVPEHRLRSILGGFLFYGSDVFKKAAVLSGGEKMRLAMACLFSSNANSELLILDEPTNNLDLESIDQLTQSIKEYPGSLIVISHDESFVRDIGMDKIIAL